LVSGFAVLLMAACSASSPPGGQTSDCGLSSPVAGPLVPVSPSAQMVSWSCSGITFSYPIGWYRTTESFPSSFTDMVAAVSNQPVHDPCAVSGNSITCGQPLDSLEPGGLLIEWWEDGFPQWSIASQPGTPTTVAGLQARLQAASAPGSECPTDLGADTSINVVIARTVSNNYYEFVACIRGPETNIQVSTAMAILHSVEFAYP